MDNRSSVLDAVTVYSQGALCARLATVAPVEGRTPEQVRLTGLPLSLDPGSLRAFVVEGPQDCQVLEVRASFDAVLPEEKDLGPEQQKLEEAEKLEAQLRREQATLQADLERTASLRPEFPTQKRGDPPRAAPVEAIIELAGFVESQLATLQARAIELEEQLRDAHNAVNHHRAMVQEATSARVRSRAQVYRAAELRLSPTMASAEVKLRLEYVVPGARWAPAYQLRLDRGLCGGSLQVWAHIAQRSGEDWTGVRLSLSTASFNRRTDLLELKSLRIGRAQPAAPRPGWRDPPAGLDELFSGYDAASLVRPLPPSQVVPEPELRTKERASRARPRFDEEPEELSASEPVTPFGLPPAPPPAASMPMPAQLKKRLSGAAKPAPSAMMASPKGAMTRQRTLAPGSRGGAPSREELEEQMEAPSMSSDFDSSEDFDEAPSAVADFASLDEGGGFESKPTGLEVNQRMLDYGQLEMAPPDSGSAERGRLRPTSRTELAALMAVHVEVDVVMLVSLAVQQASAVRDLSLPSYAVPPFGPEQRFDYRYDAANRLDVPSDGAWHAMPVTTAQVGVEGRYVTIPSVDPKVFRTVRVLNRSTHALLAGPVDVTLGEEFLMTCPFPTIAPQGSGKVGLGVEESIQVSRNTHFEENSGGLFGGATVLTHRVKVEVANRLPSSAVVEVHEKVSVPAPGEDDVKVEETQVQPAWQSAPREPGDPPVNGERRWELTVPAGAKQELSASWVVKIPSSKMLVGGNRRV